MSEYLKHNLVLENCRTGNYMRRKTNLKLPGMTALYEGRVHT